MRKFTEEQKEFFTKEEERLNSFFKEPIYQEYKIRYVRFKKADVVISKFHNVLDYMAIGFACLEKQQTGGEKILRVAHKDYVSMELVKAYEHFYPPQNGGKSLPQNALIDSFEKISKVAEKYYKNPQAYNSIVGVTFSTYLTAVAMEYAEIDNIELEFENFDDTVVAQKLAFENLKRFIISTTLGALQAMMFGED